jgi:hypothetical protein
MPETRKCAIATPLLSDAATIEASDEVASMPAAHLQRFQPTDWWQTNSLGGGGQHLMVDLGASPGDYNLVSLLYTNALSTTEWRVRTGLTEAGTTADPSYDSGWIDHWPVTGLETWEWTHSLLWLPSGSERDERWVRIDIRDAALDFYRAGRLYIANAWQPTHHVKFGWGAGFTEQTRRQYAEGGPVFPRIQPRRRTMPFRFNFLEEDEIFENAWEIDRRRGTSEDVLVVFDPTHPKHVHRWMVYGLMKDLPPVVNDAYQIYEKPFEIEEAI